MAAFKFRLEKMLHFMRLKETMKKLEVSTAQGRVDFLTRRKEMLENSARALLAQNSLSVYHTTKIAVDAREAQRLVGQINEEQSILDKRKRELARLIFRKKGLESLREKKHEEFRTDENRRVQKNMDDLHAIRRIGAGGRE